MLLESPSLLEDLHGPAIILCGQVALGAVLENYLKETYALIWRESPVAMSQEM